MGILLSLSDNLSKGIIWNITAIPTYNKSAQANNGTGITGYDIAVNTVGGLTADVYIKADGNLNTTGGDTIGLGNETFSYNTTNSSVPSKTKYKLSTELLDNKIGDNLPDGSYIYLKFFLTVPPGQAAGTYYNNVTIEAIPYGYSP